MWLLRLNPYLGAQRIIFLLIIIFLSLNIFIPNKVFATRYGSIELEEPSLTEKLLRNPEIKPWTTSDYINAVYSNKIKVILFGLATLFVVPQIDKDQEYINNTQSEYSTKDLRWNSIIHIIKSLFISADLFVHTLSSYWGIDSLMNSFEKIISTESQDKEYTKFFCAFSIGVLSEVWPALINLEDNKSKLVFFSAVGANAIFPIKSTYDALTYFFDRNKPEHRLEETVKKIVSQILHAEKIDPSSIKDITRHSYVEYNNCKFIFLMSSFFVINLSQMCIKANTDFGILEKRTNAYFAYIFPILGFFPNIWLKLVEVPYHCAESIIRITKKSHIKIMRIIFVSSLLVLSFIGPIYYTFKKNTFNYAISIVLPIFTAHFLFASYAMLTILGKYFSYISNRDKKIILEYFYDFIISIKDPEIGDIVRLNPDEQLENILNKFQLFLDRT